MTQTTIHLFESTNTMNFFRSIGLTKYETIAYLTLLKHGPQNCKSLAYETKIPSGKIYSTTQNLIRKGWIKVSMSERPKVLYARDPKFAIKKRIEELREKLIHLEVIAEEVTITLNNICYLP